MPDRRQASEGTGASYPPGFNIELLFEVQSSLKELHIKHDSLHVELLGNGQPGRIQRMEKDIKDDQEQLVIAKGKIKWYAGLIAGLSFIGGLLVSLIDKGLFSKF